jgi:predicted TIM-barrel fold metal-dependent hydrolase
MKNALFAAAPLLLLFSGSVASAQPREREVPPMRIDEYNPKSTLKVPEHPRTRAKFPFIDVHNHQTRTLESNTGLDKLVSDMDALNMKIMVNLSGGFGERLAQTVKGMKTRYPDRFVVFANVDFRGMNDPGYPDKAAKQLEEDIRNGAQGLKFFKNFGMELKDDSGQRVHVDDHRLDKVFEVCAKYKIPVLIHTAEPKPFFDPIDKNNERWLELMQFPSRARPADKFPTWDTLMNEQMSLFARHPKVNFINAHLGWLGGDLEELGRRMDKLPNMYTEIGAVLAELGRQPRAARAFFTKYQDRVMFGKDIWEPSEYYVYFRVLETADEYFDYYRKRHAFWKMYGMDLPDDILKKLYYKNALKLIPGLDASKFPK